MRAMKIISMALIVAMGAGLSACGSSKGERAITGGALGAGAGAVCGALLGSPAAGAVVGGAAGAATGALTDKDDINFGKPIWKWD
jgi:osmotically inducible lipoprotein OsmB